MSPVELRRILGEWRLRVQRIKDILQPAAWNEKEWRQFSQALALLVRDHGKSWIIDPNVYWDLRWKLQDGGELVCQVEHIPGEKTSLVVAQTGGFAQVVDSYTWLWAEFDLEGEFTRDPYWVDGTWKDALTTLLLPLDRQSSFMLAGRVDTPESLLLQEGARPNDGNFNLALPSAYAEEEPPEELAPFADSPPEEAAEETSEAGPDETPASPDGLPSDENPAFSPEGVAVSEASIGAEPAPPQPERRPTLLTENEARFRRLRARTRYALTPRKTAPRSRRR